MKQSNVVRIGLRNLFTLRMTWLYAGVYILIMLTVLMIIARHGSWSNRGIFDVMADVGSLSGSTNHHMLMFVAIPVIVALMTQCIQRTEKGLIVTKLGTRFSTFQSQAVSAIILSFCLTCLILIISFLIGGSLVGYENTWLKNSGTIGQLLKDKEHFQAIVTHLATFKIVWTLFITKFLGFLMIAFLTLFLKQFIKSSAFIMMILIAIAALDETGVLPVPIFTWTMTLSWKNWLDPMVTVYHSIYLIIVSCMLYGVTGLLFERKDFLS